MNGYSGLFAEDEHRDDLLLILRSAANAERISHDLSDAIDRIADAFSIDYSEIWE